MSRILLIHSSVDGQTRRICERIQSQNQDIAEVELVNLNEANALELNHYDKILIGASIRYGKLRPEVMEFISTHLQLLNNKQSGFFIVNVVARKPDKNTPLTNPYMKKFLLQSPWQPQYQAVFAGKIDYPKYTWFDRTMIRFIMRMTKGPTDVSGCYEFTDWQQVENFGRDFCR